MPFVRFARDRRGYEHVYLIDTSRDRGRSRVLYWFRTPPGVKVGRNPFDPDTQRSLERQNPDVQFDWAQIVAARMPPPAPVENWREKRRAERAFKKARATEVAETGEPDRNAPVDEDALAAADELEDAGQEPAIIDATDVESDEVLDEGDEGEQPSGESPIGEENAPTPVAGQPAVGAVSGIRRSRRRRRRKGRRPGGPQGNATPPAAPNGGLDPPDPPKEPSNEG